MSLALVGVVLLGSLLAVVSTTFFVLEPRHRLVAGTVACTGLTLIVAAIAIFISVVSQM